MTFLKALAEIVAYLQGVGPIEPDRGAALIVEQLEKRGLSVQPTSAPILHDLTPASLRRVRKALAITKRRLAEEASISPITVTLAEMEDARSREATVHAMADALVRLGAKRPR